MKKKLLHLQLHIDCLVVKVDDSVSCAKRDTVQIEGLASKVLTGKRTVVLRSRPYGATCAQSNRTLEGSLRNLVR